MVPWPAAIHLPSRERQETVLKGNIVITGGSGFLGRAILRRGFTEEWPCHFTIYSRDEEHQWHLKHRWPEVTCILGDVRDYDRLETTFAGQDMVIHAAAIKFVPEAEFNVAEAIAVNLRGSENVARAAVRVGVKKVIAISTDKACLPVNVYGMTKALMERLFAEANTWGDTKFTTVRYGNVVGSTGSVIPLFQRQREVDGFLTVTDKGMTRFWLSPEDAVGVILAADKLDLGGAIMVPRCGAMALIALAELIAGGCDIKIVGARPGEKAHEELIHHRESLRATLEDNFYILSPVGSVDSDYAAEPFTYASHSPARWLDADWMKAAMEDASTV